MKDQAGALVIDKRARVCGPALRRDLFKLESPVRPATFPSPLARVSRGAVLVSTSLDPGGRAPWVMLVAGAGMDRVPTRCCTTLTARRPGYLAGRAIWLEAFQRFPDGDGIRDELRCAAVP